MALCGDNVTWTHNRTKSTKKKQKSFFLLALLLYVFNNFHIVVGEVP